MLGPELTAEEAERLPDVGEFLPEILGGQPVELGPVLETVFHGDAALVPEPVALAHGLGHDKDVGKQDGGIEGKPAQWLEGDLGRQRGSAHEVGEGMPGLELAVFRQVAAGLAHDPDRRPLERAAGAGGEKAFPGGHGRINRRAAEPPAE